MTKKFVMSIIVSFALLFTVAFQAPAEAAHASVTKQEIKKQLEIKLAELLEEKVDSRVAHAFTFYVNNWYGSFDHNGKQSEQVPANDQKHVEKQAPKKEQNNEQKQAPKKQDPKQEEQQQQPKKEQNKEQEVKQPATPPKQQEQPREQQPAPQAPQAQQGQLSQFEQEVIDLTNAERSKYGLAPLQADVELSAVARDKSKDMAARNYFDHNSPTYGSPFDMMRAYGIDYRAAGENIAKGQRTPQEVVQAWMNSQGHRENILSGNFTHIGVGYVEQGNHWTQMFIGK